MRFGDIHEKIETGEYKLAVNIKPSRSTVWRVYRKIEKDDGTCLEDVLYCIGCKRILSFLHKSTTNLRRHRCHLQFLKKQTACDLSYGTQTDNDNDEVTLAMEADQSLTDEIEIKPFPIDVAPCVAAVPAAADRPVPVPSPANQLVISPPHPPPPPQQSLLPQQPPQPPQSQQPQVASDFTPSHEVSGVAESNIYAQTWSLEFQKLSEDQKFYAKKAIDEIFVLGRLSRLTLNTVSTAE
ncbi:hypothetical protein KR018_003835 [Drosophila ironensis]|nr:hypothetical protein KR018_003835 [Drosophila ironensis]